MRISKLATTALAASIALTALAGCGTFQMTPTSVAQSGVGSSSFQGVAFQNGRLNGFLAPHGGIVPAHGLARPSFMDPSAVGKPLVFLGHSGYPHGTIDIYLQGGKNKMVGQITGPAGAGSSLATDNAGNLYSANTSTSSSVTIYAPPYGDGPKLTITGSNLSNPIAVSRQGTVAVLCCTVPSVLFYAAGSTTPCATVVLGAAFQTGAGAAFDRKGNLYVNNGGSATDAPLTVGKIRGGCKAKKTETSTTANAIAYAGGLQVDKAGRIAILVALGTYPYTIAIDTYDPPKNGTLGNPVSTTSLPVTLNTTSGTFALQASGRGLWTGYYGAPSYVGGAYKVAYPAGGTPQKTILGPSDAATDGVAVTPALTP